MIFLIFLETRSQHGGGGLQGVFKVCQKGVRGTQRATRQCPMSSNGVPRCVQRVPKRWPGVPRGRPGSAQCRQWGAKVAETDTLGYAMARHGPIFSHDGAAGSNYVSECVLGSQGAIKNVKSRGGDIKQKAETQNRANDPSNMEKSSYGPI